VYRWCCYNDRKENGLLAEIKNVNNAIDIIYMHSIIHRKALADKKISHEYTEVLKEALSVVNFIRSQMLNSWLFSKLCKVMGSNHNKILHAEVK
jgi:hypothetical protein